MNYRKLYLLSALYYMSNRITFAFLLYIMILPSMGVAAESSAVPKAGSPLSNFYDDSLLFQSTIDIGNMHHPELDMLADTLATCAITGIADDELQSNECRILIRKFEILYDEDRAIDTLLNVVDLMQYRLRLESKLPRKSSSSEDAKNILRLVKMEDEWEKSVSSRNRELAESR